MSFMKKTSKNTQTTAPATAFQNQQITPDQALQTKGGSVIIEEVMEI